MWTELLPGVYQVTPDPPARRNTVIDFAECPSCGSEFTNEEYTTRVHHMICECGCYFTVPITAEAIPPAAADPATTDADAGAQMGG
jgi:hypothetical protein